jgi:hypothetical protein
LAGATSGGAWKPPSVCSSSPAAAIAILRGDDLHADRQSGLDTTDRLPPLWHNALDRSHTVDRSVEGHHRTHAGRLRARDHVGV